MAEYLAPGVYIEEIERGPKPIEGVSTSTAAFLGETERGSVTPRFITSYNEYMRNFGGVFSPDQYMPYAVSSFFENGGRRCVIGRIFQDAANAAPAYHDFNDYRVSASGPGSWGKRIFVKVVDSTTKNKDGTAIGIRLRIAYWQTDPGTLPDPFVGTVLASPPTMIEDFDDLVLTDTRSANYYGKRIPGNSSLISFEAIDGVVSPAITTDVSSALDQAGADGTDATVTDYVGENDDPSLRTGLAALLLDPYREVSLVYAPNADDDVVAKVISHCENQHFRFAVIDAASGLGNAGNIDPRSQNDSKYAAYYYPWISISDPQTGAKKRIPPGGAVLGIYARTDGERGVFKAPANEIVRGALQLEYNVDERTQELLNPRGVNVIRQFPGRGIRVWGARTLSSDSLWKYVSVRRLFIFLEASIYEGTQWVVFEPNDERLWSRVKDTIRLFLRTQYRLGALMGATEAEAFHITCDRSTMTQDDILNGRLICEIGIAPVRPAEFVVFKIFQSTAEAQT